MVIWIATSCKHWSVHVTWVLGANYVIVGLGITDGRFFHQCNELQWGIMATCLINRCVVLSMNYNTILGPMILVTVTIVNYLDCWMCFTGSSIYDDFVLFVNCWWYFYNECYTASVYWISQQYCYSYGFTVMNAYSRLWAARFKKSTISNSIKTSVVSMNDIVTLGIKNHHV